MFVQLFLLINNAIQSNVCVSRVKVAGGVGPPKMSPTPPPSSKEKKWNFHLKKKKPRHASLIMERKYDCSNKAAGDYWVCECGTIMLVTAYSFAAEPDNFFCHNCREKLSFARKKETIACLRACVPVDDTHKCCPTHSFGAKTDVYHSKETKCLIYDELTREDHSWRFNIQTSTYARIGVKYSKHVLYLVCPLTEENGRKCMVASCEKPAEVANRTRAPLFTACKEHVYYHKECREIRFIDITDRIPDGWWVCHYHSACFDYKMQVLHPRDNQGDRPSCTKKHQQIYFNNELAYRQLDSGIYERVKAKKRTKPAIRLPLKRRSPSPPPKGKEEEDDEPDFVPLQKTSAVAAIAAEKAFVKLIEEETKQSTVTIKGGFSLLTSTLTLAQVQQIRLQLVEQQQKHKELTADYEAKHKTYKEKMDILTSHNMNMQTYLSIAKETVMLAKLYKEVERCQATIDQGTTCLNEAKAAMLASLQ